MRKATFLLLTLFLFYLHTYSGAHGGIKGKIIDNDNNPIEGVQLTIINMEYPSERHTVKTNKKGEFIQIGLYPGYYQVRCEKDKYLPEVKNIKISISKIVEIEIILTSSEKYIAPEQSPEDMVLRKAYELFQQGQYEEAAKVYKEAIDKDPENPTLYYNLGIAYMRLDKPDEAIQAFKKMIEIQPDSFSALKNLGELYAKEKYYEEASKYFSLAVNISSDDPEAYFNLGVSLMNCGDYPGAMEAFQRSINCQRNYAASYYQLGLLYVNQNKLEEAVAAFEKFLKLAPKDTKASTARKIIEFIKKKKT